MIIAGVYAYKKYHDKKKAKELNSQSASARHDKLIASVQRPINDGSVQAPPNAIPLHPSMIQTASGALPASEDVPYATEGDFYASENGQFKGNPFEQISASNRHSMFSERSPTCTGPPPRPPPKDVQTEDPFCDPELVAHILPHITRRPTDSSSQYSRPASSHYAASVGSVNQTPSLSRSDSTPNSPPLSSLYELSSEIDDTKDHRRLSSLDSRPENAMLSEPARSPGKPSRGKWIWVAEDEPETEQALNNITSVEHESIGARSEWSHPPLFSDSYEHDRRSYQLSPTQHTSFSSGAGFVVKPLSIRSKGRSDDCNVPMAELPGESREVAELPTEIPAELETTESRQEDEEPIDAKSNEQDIEKWWLRLKQGRDSWV